MDGDRWLIGRGWDQDRFEEKRFPTREDIDAVAGSSPALMVRVCGHIGVVNSLAIRKIKEPTKYSSELVPRSENGQIDGLVKEAALDCVWRKIPPPSEKLLTELFAHAQQKALSVGLIGVHCILSENWRIELSAIKSLDRTGRLTLKTSLFLPVTSLSMVERMTPEVRRRELNGRNFATIGFKLFADGSLGARTAALLRPYSDEPSTSGVLYYKTGYVTNVARRVKRLGMVLATHAIGDRAVKQVADAYEDAGIDSEDGFRIEHASVLNRELLLRLNEVIVSVQPSFIASDYWIEDRLGQDKTRFAYPLRTLLELKGKDLIAGSDSPVESLSPVQGICSALKNPMEGESLTLREAINIYTTNAAGKSPLTEDTGLFATGMKCSLIVFDCTNPERICSSNVSAVLIDGKVEFRKKSGFLGK